MPKVWWMCLVLGCGSAGVWGQTVPAKKVREPMRPAATVPLSTGRALLAMQARAAVIFAGHVVTVDREDAVGFVDVSFRVDEPVRGCNKLGTYVLREWAGLWTSGAPRYVAGQRLLMLLQARGAGGMSAPIDGLDGAIPIVANATEPLADSRGVAPGEDGSSASDVTGMTADLRWVEAKVTRKTAVLVTAGSGAGVADWVGPVAAMSKPAAQPSVAAVLTLLRGATGGSLHEER